MVSCCLLSFTLELWFAVICSHLLSHPHYRGWQFCLFRSMSRTGSGYTTSGELWLRCCGSWCPWTMLTSSHRGQVCPWKFRRMLQCVGPGVHSTYQRSLGMALLSVCSQESLWIKSGDRLSANEDGKKSLLLFFISVPWVSGTWCVLQGYICGEDSEQSGRLGWAGRELTFSNIPALISGWLGLLREADDLLSPFHRGWVLFWKHPFPWGCQLEAVL